MYKKWTPAIVITLLILILIGIKVYPKVYPYISSFSTSSKNHDGNKSKSNRPIAETPKHRDITKEATFPFEMKEREDFAKKYPDQFKIVQKMYYSWDYIDNAQGKYEFGETSGETYRGQFYVDLIKKKNMVKEQKLEHGKVVATQVFLFENGVATLKNLEKKIFTRFTHYPNTRSPKEFETDSLSTYSKVITNSEWYVLLYNNYPDWSYKKTTAFGMPVYKIKGTISKDKSESLSGPFTMIVSKNTGALLELKCYGKKNKVIYFVKTKDIKINQGVPESVFHLNLTGDKEVPFKEFK